MSTQENINRINKKIILSKRKPTSSDDSYDEDTYWLHDLENDYNELAVYSYCSRGWFKIGIFLKGTIDFEI